MEIYWTNLENLPSAANFFIKNTFILLPVYLIYFYNVLLSYQSQSIIPEKNIFLETKLIGGNEISRKNKKANSKNPVKGEIVERVQLKDQI